MALINFSATSVASCGASISVQTPDRVWHHCGNKGWEDIKEIVAFTIQTIVEGSVAEVNSDAFELPVRVSEVENWMTDMEAQADDLWKEANEDGNDEDEEESPEPQPTGDQGQAGA